jgi:hypothetical protein
MFSLATLLVNRIELMPDDLKVQQQKRHVAEMPTGVLPAIIYA